MKLRGKLIAIGLALASVTGAVATAAPAEAQTSVYLGVGTGSPGYYQTGWRGDDYGYRDRGQWRGGYRDWDRRDRRAWRGEGWRRGGYGWNGGWNGGYRERCWTEWRNTRWDGRVPVRICR
ncbi:MAG TPA: hypothetical protein VF475_07355 [Sphingobium sp.]